MPDQILIRGLKLSTKIGVPAEERSVPQTIRVHLTLDLEKFPDQDELEGTVNYHEVAVQARKLAASGERKLIETLAEDLAAMVLQEFQVLKVRVEIEKFILPETDWVGVIIERSIDDSLQRN